MNNQDNTVTQKEDDNSPETKLKFLEGCDLNDKRIQNSSHEKTQDTRKLRKAIQ